MNDQTPYGILVIGIVIVGGLLGFACSVLFPIDFSSEAANGGINEASTVSVSSETSSESTKTPKRKQPADLAVFEAYEVWNIYSANEVLADRELKNKWFAVRGKVGSIGTDILSTPYVTLSADDEFDVHSVQCMFSDSDRPLLAELRKGQYVVIAGVCRGKMWNIIMRKCYFYSVRTGQ